MHVLTRSLWRRFDVEPSILKRALLHAAPEDERQAKRQKSSDPPSSSSISDKVAADGYSSLQDMADDVYAAVTAALDALNSQAPESPPKPSSTNAAAQIHKFKEKAMAIIRREKAYPRTASDSPSSAEGHLVLSLVGYAPEERRLFSSLPFSHDDAWARDNCLPAGVSVSRVVPSAAQEKTQTLGELFGPPRSLPPLQPPRQPKTQAKGTVLDVYHPQLADVSEDRGNTYFNTKLLTGHFLDYSNATPSWQTKTKKHERAQSLAGKKPSSSEIETSEFESLHRGAFSSFAPCKDDSTSLVPSSTAGKIWWQRAGRRSFQSMIEVEYYEERDPEPVGGEPENIELDESAVQEAIDNWDDSAVDPTLEEIVGSRRDDREKEVDEILDEVSDMIETLASYQRIRNLQLPNSQNRQSSDPITGDMLANSSPKPSEEEQATYQTLKAQLALIIKTLPPYAVAKLNGDQLDNLLISTKLQVKTDEYKGVMDEDEAGLQARIRAQQQAAAAAQSTPRPPSQRNPSISHVPYPSQYHGGNQYGTPHRTPSHTQQHYNPTPNYQQQARSVSQPQFQPRPPSNQYQRPNGYPSQFASQLAKAQTPYGHQNIQQYAGQQRPQQYGQMPQQSGANTRYPYQQGFSHQPGTPTPSSYGSYANGGSMPPRNASPQVQHQHRQAYSPSPNMQQQQQPPRYVMPNQSARNQMNRFPGQNFQANQSNPGLTGYHTVIPEAQQQRIIDQAKARFAAQERSNSFTDKISNTGAAGFAGGGGAGGQADANRLALARASMASQQKPSTPTGTRQGANGTPTPQHIPQKVTPVPLPAMPGSQAPQKPS